MGGQDLIFNLHQRGGPRQEVLNAPQPIRRWAAVPESCSVFAEDTK